MIFEVNRNGMNQQAIKYFSLVALADLGFFTGVTFGTGASEASKHWGGLGLWENEIWPFVS